MNMNAYNECLSYRRSVTRRTRKSAPRRRSTSTRQGFKITSIRFAGNITSTGQLSCHRPPAPQTIDLFWSLVQTEYLEECQDLVRKQCRPSTRSVFSVKISAVKRSIGFTIGFHNHGEGPY